MGESRRRRRVSTSLSRPVGTASPDRPGPRRRGADRRAYRTSILERLEGRLLLASSLSVGNTTFNLAAGAAGFQVTRSGDLTPTVDVGYSVTAGTAVSGTNYSSAAPTGTLHFASGQTTATIPLTILSNNFAEATRAFTVDLTGVVDAYGPSTTFSARQTFAAGKSYSAAVADVNGDGLPDIVNLNYASNTVSVLLNTTTPGATAPSFAAQQTFSTGSRPLSVAMEDVNGDGLPDIIVANGSANRVSVLLNTTTPGATAPSFAAQQTFATGTSPRRVTAADVNGDGLPDIVVANRSSANVSVLLNTTAAGATTPSFAAQQTFAVGTAPYAVAAADLNGDGKPDLVAANYNSGSVSVLLNTTAAGATTPSFAAQQTFSTGAIPQGLAIADINSDGKPDVAITNKSSKALSVLLNTTATNATTLTFAARQSFATGTAPYAVTAADLNGDGRPDLVVSNFASSSDSVLLNTTAPGATAPSFAGQQTFSVGTNPYDVAIADLNGDGLPDLVNALFSANAVSVILNTTSHAESTTAGVPSPSFPRSGTFSTGSSPYAAKAADLNGDGLPDIITANFATNSVSVLLNTGTPGASTPSFAAGQSFSTGSIPADMAVADVNGDGLPDLVVANYGTTSVSVLLNTTTPGATTLTFSANQTFAAGVRPISVAMADLNGDGRPDVLVANESAGSVSVLLNTTAAGATTPSFSARQSFAVGSIPYSVAVADVNGDGKPDIVAANDTSGSVSVLLNTTAAGATAPSFAAQQTFAAGTDSMFVAAGDVNGDGKPDLAVANRSVGSVSVLLNTTATGATTPSFAARQTFAVGSHPYAAAIADVNGDGKPDLIASNAGSASVSVLLNTTTTGSTTLNFAAQQTYGAGNFPRSVAVADLNKDGWLDILVPNMNGSAVSVLLNTPAVLGSHPAAGTIAGAPVVSSIALADANPTGAATVHFTVTFSKAVSGVAAANFILSGTSASGLSVGTPTSSDGGTTWTVPVATGGGGGTLGLTLDDRTGITDADGNILYDTTSDDGTTFTAVVGPQYTIATATTTSVVSSLSPSTYGQSVTFTATVTDPSSSGVPTGSVAFYDSTTLLGAGTSLSGSGSSATSTFTLSTLTAAGHSITAVYTATGDFLGSTSSILTQTVNAAPLTITADDQSKVYGANLPTLTASYSGFVNGDTSASLTTLPTLTTTATAASSVAGGPYAITASGAVDTNYTITYVPGSLTVTAAPLTITADDQSKVYGATLPTLTASYSGFVNGDTSASLTTQPTLTTAATAGSPVAGSPYAITASGAIDGNYSITYVPGSLTVNAAPLTITADNQSKVYGAALPTLTASYSGFVNGDTSASLTTLPTLTTTATAGSPVAGGPYAITASGAVDGNYSITYVPGSLTVTAAPLTITADNQSKVYGAALPTLTASYSGFVNGDTSASLTTLPTLTTAATAASPVAGGPYAITASGAVDGNYTISYVPGSLAVTAAPLTITADDQSKVYGAALPTLTLSYSGFVNGDTAASLTTQPTPTTAATAGSPVAGGPYAITAAGAVDSNYSFTYVPGSLTVTAAPLTITADNQSKVYGAAIPSLTASYSGFVNGDTAASLTAAPTLTTAATAGSSVAGGPYAITAAGAVDSNYSFTYVPGSLTVTAAPLTITADNQSKVYGAALPTLTASYSGLVNGDTPASLATPPTLTTSATAASPVVGGPYAITAAGAIDSNYTISYVPGSLAVSAAPLTITANDQTKAYGAALPPLTASYSGFVNGDTPASLTALPTLATAATADSPAGTYAITAAGAVDSNYGISYVPGTLTIQAPLGISPTTLPAGTVGVAYLQQLTASGGSGSGYQFTATGLPPGLSLTDLGLLAGTPTAASDLPFTVVVSVGDGDGNTATQAYSLTIEAPSTTGSVAPSTTQSYYGQPVMLTATFTATQAGSAPMTGTVAFYVGDTYLGTAPLMAPGASGLAAASLVAGAPTATVSGTATLPTSALPVGDSSITAVYSGDANYPAASAVSTATVQVLAATTSVNLTASNTAQGVVLVATVSVTSPGDPPIEGVVSFYDNGTLLGTEPVSNGHATLNVGTPAPGPHAFLAVFSGGGTFSGSAAPAVVPTPLHVTGLARYGYHMQPTYLLLSLDGPAASAAAQDPSNYRVVGPLGGRVRVVRAVYDPASQTVTLAMAGRLKLHARYRLTVHVAALSGPTGGGQPGADDVLSVTWRNLAGRAGKLPTRALLDEARQQAVLTGTPRHQVAARPHAVAIDHLLATDSMPARPRRPPGH
ncbi:FG-GAP repeat protein [Aquisphaera giovannonii]|uniref:FG-GAP repeat protein n=1 Tax=Aquisphaera giovannonii TaxID=406548 RepID=A0A5B9VWT3_9BACT|nr:MBG domain-containing protein [Aquisphaera giovannonii]QEH32331.1 FG-GAP repeat protein [Aquisphaera giovannonii]